MTFLIKCASDTHTFCESVHRRRQNLGRSHYSMDFPTQQHTCTSWNEDQAVEELQGLITAILGFKAGDEYCHACSQTGGVLRTWAAARGDQCVELFCDDRLKVREHIAVRPTASRVGSKDPPPWPVCPWQGSLCQRWHGILSDPDEKVIEQRIVYNCTGLTDGGWRCIRWHDVLIIGLNSDTQKKRKPGKY